jgi:hypothetical protein
VYRDGLDDEQDGDEEEGVAPTQVGEDELTVRLYRAVSETAIRKVPG